jgi:hypothetical protein
MTPGASDQRSRCRLCGGSTVFELASRISIHRNTISKTNRLSGCVRDTGLADHVPDPFAL